MTQPDGVVTRLVETYQPQLNRYAAALTHDDDQAADLVQEAFIQAAAHQDLLARLEEAQRCAWLYTVVKNRFIDQVRARRRQEALIAGLQDLLLSDAASPRYAGEAALFARIPARYRKLLFQRYVYNMTSDEIAQELHVPAATVRSRIRLALAWLRSHIDEWS